MSSVAGINITPESLANQWSMLSHRFDLNVWNFEVKAGRAAVSVFRKSFDIQRFNSRGSSPWPQRSPLSNSGSHPILRLSGTLRGSIKATDVNNGRANRTVIISTDPAYFSHARRHPGFCYARVHNDDDPSYRRISVFGKKTTILPQRQFMGHSTELDAKLEKLEPEIFNGFPK